MAPESVDSRMGRLEQSHARLDQRVDGLAQQVTALVPLTAGFARLEEVVNGVKDDVLAVGGQVSEVRSSIAKRDQQQTEDRRSLKIVLLGLTGTIAAALIAAVATIVASGAHP